MGLGRPLKFKGEAVWAVQKKPVPSEGIPEGDRFTFRFSQDEVVVLDVIPSQVANTFVVEPHEFSSLVKENGYISVFVLGQSL